MATLKELLAQKAKETTAPVLGKTAPPANRATRAPETALPEWHTNQSLAAGGFRDPDRELGSTDGQQIPDEWPGPGTGDFDWKQAYGAFTGELCVVLEPAPSAYAWLSVGRKDKPGRPILLARLPLHSLGAGERAEAF